MSLVDSDGHGSAARSGDSVAAHRDRGERPATGASSFRKTPWGWLVRTSPSSVPLAHPAVGSEPILIPPVMEAWSIPVPNMRLDLVYTFDETYLVAVSLRRR